VIGNEWGLHFLMEVKVSNGGDGSNGRGVLGSRSAVERGFERELSVSNAAQQVLLAARV
jgi:hypothetical protein